MKKLFPHQALNAAYRRMQIDHDSYMNFLKELNHLISNIKEGTQDEITQKDFFIKFLINTFYGKNIVASEGQNDVDLSIKMSDDESSNAGVMFELKKVGSPEMPTVDNLNTKALHELILYYMRQRNKGNTDVRHLVATNTREFFVFDAKEFERLFYQNSSFRKIFIKFEAGDFPLGSDTDVFYKEIAKPELEKVQDDITFTYFSLKDYKRDIEGKAVTGKLTHIYRLLSPVHLLKQPFQNDSNYLDANFYKELLHLIGLEEVKEKSKSVIRRKSESKRSGASLLESTLDRLKTEDKHIYLSSSYGDSKDEKLFNAALELCVTWINRILFLKLLEAQLINYHQDKNNYKFLTYDKVGTFAALYNLFFKVMAVEPDKRDESLRLLFPNVPYLNSSLFEQTNLERQCFSIFALDSNGQLPMLSHSVLHNDYRYKKKKLLPFLEYFFEFLDAYNFSSEGNGDVAEKPKTLINASVLGLIFEKINGYKDGSVYTPGFITRYMCKNAIRQAVLHKFNEHYNWNLKTFDEIFNADYEKKKANELINSLKICDPGVGSGHFLVSALNEIILIKSELGCLFDTSGKRIRSDEYEISVENDELIITYSESEDNNELWRYKPSNTESNRIQEALFNEKRTIIENCLFGVDINPNSVNICRLRLWIELLKNAYYTNESHRTQLETLPNIDINIKCGNSLLYKYALDDAINNQNIKNYRNAVKRYKRSKSKEDKRDLMQLIDKLKNELVSSIDKHSPVMVRRKSTLRKFIKLTDVPIFDDAKTNEDIEKRQKDIEDATKEMNKAKAELDEARLNNRYKGGFEWRLEFPEVLDDNGNFIGFDIVIGNPPYLKEGRANKAIFGAIKHSSYYQGKIDIWYMFACMGLDMLKPDGYLCFIATNNWVTSSGAKKLRQKINTDAKIIRLCNFNDYMIFKPAASIQTMIMQFQKSRADQSYQFDLRNLLGSKLEDVIKLLNKEESNTTQYLEPTYNRLEMRDQYITFSNDDCLLDKVKNTDNVIFLNDTEITQGIVPNPDVVNSRNIKRFSEEEISKHEIQIGNPVFIVPKKFFPNLSKQEKDLLKPIFEPVDFSKYALGSSSSDIIYLTKSNSPTVVDMPNILSHLTKYRPIMEGRRENQQGRIKYYHLHWPREQATFDYGEKILVPRKCATPIFCYTEIEAYVMMAINVIKTSRIDMKYLSGLLNSKLIAFWLRKQGKMQGLNYQLDKEPLQQIPIAVPKVDVQTRIGGIVEEIIDRKSADENASIQDLENQIDNIVYHLYDLTYDEVLIIDPQTPISLEEYESVNLDTYGQS